jgi:translation initiation factor IF-2
MNIPLSVTSAKTGEKIPELLQAVAEAVQQAEHDGANDLVRAKSDGCC